MLKQLILISSTLRSAQSRQIKVFLYDDVGCSLIYLPLEFRGHSDRNRRQRHAGKYHSTVSKNPDLWA